MIKHAGLAVGVLVLVGTVGCGGAPDDDARNMPAEEVAQPVATSSIADETQPAPETTAAAAETDLPATASPLPLVGSLGLVLVGASLAMRRLRGRWR
jgi:hypothetical protein